MLFKCWASVADGGPTFKQHWINESCLLCGLIQSIDLDCLRWRELLTRIWVKKRRYLYFGARDVEKKMSARLTDFCTKIDRFLFYSQLRMKSPEGFNWFKNRRLYDTWQILIQFVPIHTHYIGHSASHTLIIGLYLIKNNSPFPA